MYRRRISSDTLVKKYRAYSYRLTSPPTSRVFQFMFRHPSECTR